MSDQEQGMNGAGGVKRTKSFGPGYIEVLVIALIVAAAAIYGYDHFLAQKIVTVDLKGYVREQNALLAADQITKDQWQAGLDRVDQVLETEAAAHRNHVILLKDVVLKNGGEFNVR